MRIKPISLLALGALLTGLWSCSDDDTYPTVDGANPVCTLAADHIRTEAGQKINIKGTLTDADGIKSILLWCPDLYLKKTIDLIEIYNEPLKEYQLDYTFELQRSKKADKYDIEVTVTDVAGKTTTQIVTVTFDGDYTAPYFVTAPAIESTVLLNPEETTLNIEFCVTDNRGIDYVIVELNTYDLSTNTKGESVGSYFPMKLEAYGEDTYEFSEDIPLPAQEGAYLLSIEAYDMPAQNDEVRSTKVTSVVTVLGGVDFAKMYLCDVATSAELTSDIFGVPMRVDKVGECQYRARYYNEKANTEIYFIPQKNALSPICYGLDPTDNSHLINSPGNVQPLVLPQANTYYEINFNTDTGAYDVKTYTVEPYMTPIFWEMGSNNLNTWWAWKDTGSDDWVHADDAWLQELYIGTMEENPENVRRLVKDKNNPNLYMWEDPVHYNAGDDPKFIIHNWHSHGWWNYIAWRVDDSAECDIFYYYGGVVKQAYLDWWLGAGVVDWQAWGDEATRKNILYNGGSDNWCNPHVNASGDYMLYFDAHLGRAKLVPAK